MVGREEEAGEQRAQRIIDRALAKAARLLADPTKAAGAARRCAWEVPEAYQQQVLAQIEEMIAEIRRRG